MTGDKTIAVTASCYQQIVRAKAYYEFQLGTQLTFSECICMLADNAVAEAYKIITGSSGTEQLHNAIVAAENQIKVEM